MRRLFTILFVVFFVSGAFAQWEFWEANELPTANADTAWHHPQGEDDPPSEILYSTIIDDPDLAGNKILEFSSSAVSGDHETFRNNWNADPATGATLVFRMKAIGDGNHTRDWDMYLQNGLVRERFIATGQNRIKFDKDGADLTDFGKDLAEWHIYRFTMAERQITLYIDEESLDYLSVDGDDNEGNYFQFGDNGSDTYGTYYDWIAWDITGAYAPGEGTPLPSQLTGVPSYIEKLDAEQPDQFGLSQNYPNPFNPETEIQFKVEKQSPIRINVYNVSGQLVTQLLDEQKSTGTYKVKWNGTDKKGNSLPSGIYFYKMTADNYQTVRKMTLLK